MKGRDPIERALEENGLLTAVVSISGGCGFVRYVPPGVTIEIHDYDNGQAAEMDYPDTDARREAGYEMDEEESWYEIQDEAGRAQDNNAARVGSALALLQAARDLLKAAGAGKSLARVRLAIYSTEGALRHAKLEPYRKERAAKRAGR